MNEWMTKIETGRLRVFQGGKNMENSRKKIFIGGLPANVTEDQLKEHFDKYGTVGFPGFFY